LIHLGFGHEEEYLMNENAEATEFSPILLAEDDDDQYYLTQQIFEQLLVANPLRRVVNGEELMQWLHHEGKYEDLKKYPLPDLILLDINMPKKNGIQALQEIKSDPFLKHIPVIMLTTSNDGDDIKKCYALGCNSYIAKPMELKKLTDALRIFSDYWFKLAKVRVPPKS
jgi:CheY-like chemotaxis protein